jgi:4a-hydroxytetrahydrobiopterin dehydratase
MVGRRSFPPESNEIPLALPRTERTGTEETLRYRDDDALVEGILPFDDCTVTDEFKFVYSKRGDVMNGSSTQEHIGWSDDGSFLRRSFAFADFSEAWAFMNRVALLAEKLDHHPNWSNVYNRVEINLTSHDKGNTVTSRDRRMAAAIDALVER